MKSAKPAILSIWLLLTLLSSACIPDPVSPSWFQDFVAFADTSRSYPAGSSMLRCYWGEEWVYLEENLLLSCVACQVITEAGDTIFFDTETERLDYLDNRRRCTEVWRKD